MKTSANPPVATTMVAVGSQLPQDASQHAVDQADITPEYARLHGMDGVAADGIWRRHELDFVQLGGAINQGIVCQADAGRQRSTDIVVVRRQHIEIGRGAESRR